ncbi:MAG: YebC/PmpR family DNA-binding transcriptional regulator [Pirellulaceae bacterium]
MSQLANAFEQAGIEMEVNEVVRVPQTTVDVDEETATTILKLLETLEDHDDVQAVSTNLNFEHPTIARLISSGG